MVFLGCKSFSCILNLHTHVSVLFDRTITWWSILGQLLPFPLVDSTVILLLLGIISFCTIFRHGYLLSVVPPIGLHHCISCCCSSFHTLSCWFYVVLVVSNRCVGAVCCGYILVVLFVDSQLVESLLPWLIFALLLRTPVESNTTELCGALPWQLPIIAALTLFVHPYSQCILILRNIAVAVLLFVGSQIGESLFRWLISPPLLLRTPRAVRCPPVISCPSSRVCVELSPSSPMHLVSGMFQSPFVSL